MARAIFFGRQGRFMDCGYEAQLNRASALSQVLNAMVVWNTRHFERAQTKLAQLGDPVEEAVWQHLSAIVWEHINLVGSYQFSEVQLEGEFRPLRDVEQRHRRRPKEAENTLAEAHVEQAHHTEEQEQETLEQLSLLHEEGTEEESDSPH